MAEKNQPAEVPNQPHLVEVELPLPVLPATAPQPQPSKHGVSNRRRFRNWYAGRKKLSIPLSALVLLLLLLAVPLTRYPLAGLVLKKNFTLQITDQTTNTPVSGASVSSGSVSTLTDGNGQARLRLAVGHHNLSITKKYYRDGSAKVLVPVLSAKKTPEIKLQATGRQVKIAIKNTISKKALENVDIKVSDITAKTDKDGKALIVLPAGTASQKTTLSLAGYNTAEAIIKVNDIKVEENNFSLTPTGKIYFLSKLSGKVDVVKANLDGTTRETILAGTGREDSQNTVLLAGRDWRYLALLSRRDSDLAKLYLIETATDKVTAIDEGNATFSLIGWSDANFVYRVDRNSYQLWQPKAHALKSYDAVSKKIIMLDETGAQGTSDSDYNYENFSSTYIVGQRVVYAKNWFSTYADNASLNDKQLGIYSVSITGGNRSTHKSFGYADNQSTYEQSYLAKPDEIFFQVTEKSADAKYFVYANGQVAEQPTVKDEFDNYLNGSQYITYLQSPSAKSTFWSESRDGKNSLFVGNPAGDGAKQIATLSDYQTYGWYSDDYLLISKNGSELYIMNSDGIKKDSEALKVTDYHKSVVSYPGYGGVYGGL